MGVYMYVYLSIYIFTRSRLKINANSTVQVPMSKEQYFKLAKPALVSLFMNEFFKSNCCRGRLGGRREQQEKRVGAVDGQPTRACKTRFTIKAKVVDD